MSEPDATIASKSCTKCLCIKPIDQFYRNRSSRDGRSWHCKRCHSADVTARMKTPEGKRQLSHVAKMKMLRPGEREKRRRRFTAYSRLKRYGLSTVDFERMFESQDGKCKVCRIELDFWGRQTHVDHDHTSGRIRGILCHHCNTAIGLAAESADRLRALANYLETPQ